MKVVTVFGTRPEIIKMAALIPLLDQEFEHTFVFSNQHYSKNMVEIFLSEMEVRQPDIFLGVDSSDVDKLTAAVKKALIDLSPDVVLVYGDTNSTLATARALPDGAKLVHIEAGIRSFDKRMPEEFNRIETDRLSSLRLAPTGLSKYFLTELEDYPSESVEVVGNLVVDAFHKYREKIEKTSLPDGLKPREYCLLTMHRTENVDDPVRLKALLENLETIKQPVIFPIHPRTEKRMREFGLKFPENLKLFEPMGYFQFMKLQLECNVVITDSGGIQEEAVTLGVPCITLRDNTERQETVFINSNLLYSADYRKDLYKVVDDIAGRRKEIQNLKNPYGTGDSAKKIIVALKKHFEN